MVRLSLLHFKQNKYNSTVNKDSLEKFGSIYAKHTFKANKITVSILVDSEYSNISEERYEVALFRDDLPMELPESIKKLYKDRIVFRYFLSNLNETEVNVVLKIAATLP